MLEIYWEVKVYMRMGTRGWKKGEAANRLTKTKGI